MQLLVLGFADPEFKGRISQELDRLRDNDVIRLIDVTVVRKDVGGDIAVVERSDLSLDEAEAFGVHAGSLLGLGADGAEPGAAADETGHVRDEDQVSYIADAIPGVLLAEAWVHQDDLVAIGLVVAAGIGA